MLAEVLLVGVHHPVEPGQEFLGAVVRVQDDGDSVRRSDGADEVRAGDGAGDGGELVLVGHSLWCGVESVVGMVERSCNGCGRLTLPAKYAAPP